MKIKTNSGTILTLEKDPNNTGYWIINEEFGNSHISELYFNVYLKAANWVIIEDEEPDMLEQYQIALDELSGYVGVYADNYSSVHGNMEELQEEGYQYVRILQKLIDKEVEFQSRKRKLIVGSEWICIGRCLAEAVHDNNVFTVELVRGEIFKIIKTSHTHVLFVTEGDSTVTYQIPLEQFLLCAKLKED